MDYVFYSRCFLIGILASSSLGPIFILTFNRGAMYGFWKGFATALGACIADGIYFFLSLLGILTILEQSKNFMSILDILGGILLFGLGIFSILKAWKGVEFVNFESKLGFLLIISKSFLLTILNPMVVLFFMIIAVQVLPVGMDVLPIRNVLWGSVFVAAGSLSVLSILSLIASVVGNCISQNKLRIISFITGVAFIGVGIYFLQHLIKIIFS